MDRYTKFILTMIAIGIFGLNYHLFSGKIITSAEASHNQGVAKLGKGTIHVYIDNWPNGLK